MTTVEVWGPNLPRSNHPETFHVHLAGCADIERNRRVYMHRNSDMGGWQMEASSFADIVEEIYPPDEFGYDLTDANDRAAYEQDIYVFPCIKF